MNAAPSKITSMVSVPSAAKLFAVEPITATSLMRQQEYVSLQFCQVVPQMDYECIPPFKAPF